jgi:hypothetical protein
MLLRCPSRRPSPRPQIPDADRGAGSTGAWLHLAALAVLGMAWALAVTSRPAAAQNQPPFKSGFPLNPSPSSQNASSSPLVVDLGLSGGIKSLVFGTGDGNLHVVYFNTSTLRWGEAPGWPVQVGAQIASSPAVGDINNDGVPEIVVGYGNPAGGGPGGVKAYLRSGTLLWSRPSQDRLNGGDGQPDPVLGSPAIGDIDGDGLLEVVWGSTDFQIYAVAGATGADKPGWPKTWDVIRDTVRSSPALYDLDNDGHLWVIIGVDAHLEGAPFNTPNGGCLHVFKYDGTERAGFPQCVNQVITSSPVVGDIDGDGKPEIIHGTGTFYEPPTYHPTEAVYAWHCDGTAVTGWPASISGQVGTSPALASLEGGPLDVIVSADNTLSSSTYHVYAIRGNGTRIWSAVPKDFFGATLSAGDPVVADVLGTTTAPEILVTDNTSVVIFDAAGNQLTDPGTHPAGTFAFYTQTSLSAVSVADFQSGDNKIAVVAISTAGNTAPSTPNTPQISIWNPVSRATAPAWGFFRRDTTRSGADPGAGSCATTCTPPPGTALGFFTLPPCRLVDTRNATGPMGGPALTGGQSRSFALAGSCGVPSTAKAVSLNLTVVTPTAAGDLTLGPGCVTPTSSISFAPSQTLANNVVGALTMAGALTVTAQMPSSATVQVILDVNGYFQ